MKRAACAVLALALLLSACGQANSKKGSDPVALGEKLTAQASGLPDMTVVSSQTSDGEELFPYISNMDYAKTDGYYLSYAAGGSAEEIALIRVKDPASLAEARASLEKHLEDRKGIFRTYDPAQAAMVDSAKIVAEGDTAALFVCENASELAGAFSSELKG